MGKNTNQIATFKDLTSIGYRLPSGISHSSQKCIINPEYLDIIESSTNTTDIRYQTYFSSYHGSTLPKCVKWDNIDASSGQEPPTSDSSLSNTVRYGVTVPIKVTIKESVSGSTQAGDINFYYNYKLSGSSTFNKVCTAKYTFGSVSGSSSAIVYVLINPKVSGTVVSDYLSIKCGTTRYNQNWTISYYNWTTDNTNTHTASGVTSYTLEIGSSTASVGTYNYNIKNVSEITFDIHN